MIQDYENLAIRVTPLTPYNSERGWARIQLFQGQAKIAEPVGSAPLSDFVLNREGCRRLVEKFTEVLADSSW